MTGERKERGYKEQREKKASLMATLFADACTPLGPKVFAVSITMGVLTPGSVNAGHSAQPPLM